MKYTVKIWFTLISFCFGYGSVLYCLFRFDHLAGGHLPGHYTTAEKYFVWCDYLSRRSRGKKCTFREVELEYFKKWREAIKLMKDAREKTI